VAAVANSKETHSWEVAVTKTTRGTNSSFGSDCRKSDTFTLQWIGKLNQFSLCVCAVIKAAVCCLPRVFNHCAGSQMANWKGAWHRGNIWIWPLLTLPHLPCKTPVLYHRAAWKSVCVIIWISCYLVVILQLIIVSPQWTSLLKFHTHTTPPNCALLLFISQSPCHWGDF